jgi:rSAM/selenodomain-associated transferase 1
MNAKNNTPLYLFAKSPVPGEVKTRMQPHISRTQSVELAIMMLIQSVETVCRFWPGQLVLTVTPDASHPVFERLARSHRFDVQIQVPGDLGDRMFHVLSQGIKHYGSAVVMGCDVPHLSGESLQRVHELLLDNKNVIGPARDGGFYLLGLNRITPGVFTGIQWGDEQVFSRVCQNIEDQGMALQKIGELTDIDSWDDLVWLSGRDPRYRGFVN